MMHRRPIAFQAVDDGNELYALCDDGSLWIRWADKNDPEWHEAPPIPGTARASELAFQRQCEESCLTIAQTVPR